MRQVSLLLLLLLLLLTACGRPPIPIDQALDRVIIDWMTSDHTRRLAYGYLAREDGQEPRLERLVLASALFPADYAPDLDGLPVVLATDAEIELAAGDLSIRVDAIERRDDGGVDVAFVHSGSRFIGGVYVQYAVVPDEETGEWEIRFMGAVDP